MYGRYGLGKATGRGDQRAGGEHGTVGELHLGVVATAARHLGVLGARTGTVEVVRVGTEVGDCFVPGR